MANVVLDALTKVYPNGVTALQGIGLEVRDGEFFALLGPSGCGKTTLLRVIAGLEVATEGSVRIGTRDVTRLGPGPRNVAMVFQDYALYPHMTVVDNIAYPLKVRRMAKASRRARAEEIGMDLGLAEMMSRRPAQLSGGQQQRVAVARALACRADVLLFDEPLSNLDARLRMDARAFLNRLHAERPTTTVYVTHDQSEALALADRLAVMEGGVVRQIGSPAEVFDRPANLFVAGFIGNTPMNVLDAVVEGSSLVVEGERLPIPDSAVGAVHNGQKVMLAIRPEYMTVQATTSSPATEPRPSPGGAGSGIGVLEGMVEIVENLGTSLLLTTEVGKHVVRAVVLKEIAVKRGERVRLTADWLGRGLVYREHDGTLIESPGRGAPTGLAFGELAAPGEATLTTQTLSSDIGRS